MRVRGFTLLELLVAITVLSLVSLISWRGLESLISTRARLDPEVDEIRAMITAFGQLELDASQVINPTFVPLGVPAISVRGAANQAVLELVRFAAVSAEQPSAIQTVVYELRDGTLTRQSSPAVRTIGAAAAAAQVAAPPSSAALLSGLSSFQIRVWRAGQGWADPVVGAAGDPQRPQAAPEGLEITLERTDGKRFRRVVLTG